MTAAGRGLRYARWAKRFVTFAELPEEAAFRRSYSLYDPIELEALLSPELQQDIDEVVAQHHRVYEDNRLADQVDRMCLADTTTLPSGPQPCLHRPVQHGRFDRSSGSLRRSVGLSGGLLSDRQGQGLRERTGKFALKRAAQAWLPDDIVHRPKASFSAPLRSWVTRDLRDVINDSLLGGELVETGFLNRPAVAALVQDHRSGREDRSKQIWQLLTLEFWYRQTRHAGVGL